MVKPYRRIDTTADVGLASFGSSRVEVFVNMAKGLFSLISPLPNIRREVCRKLEVRADSLEDLLVAWMNELIFIHETENLLFRVFHIDDLTEIRLKASCFGEHTDPLRHMLKMDIKGATYHRLSIQRDERGFWRARVILDV